MTTTDQAPDTPPADHTIILPDGGRLTIPGALIESGLEIDIDALLRTVTTPRTVYQAIAAVIAELEGVGKDQRGPAEQGGYAYRGIEGVTGALQKLCGKHGVVLWPSARVVDAQPSVGMKAGWFDWRVEVTYQVAGPDGSKLDPPIDVVGIGRDNSDKGVNKAMTQAYKYALLQLFMVADPKDDTDKHGAYDDGRQTEAEAGPRTLSQSTFDELAAEIKALPAAARQHLVEAWAEVDPMTGDTYLPMDEKGNPRLSFVLADHVPAVRALITDALRATKAAGEAPESPQDGSDEEPAADTADEPSDATEGDKDDSPD